MFEASQVRKQQRYGSLHRTLPHFTPELCPHAFFTPSLPSSSSTSLHRTSSKSGGHVDTHVETMLPHASPSPPTEGDAGTRPRLTDNIPTVASIQVTLPSQRRGAPFSEHRRIVLPPPADLIDTPKCMCAEKVRPRLPPPDMQQAVRQTPSLFSHDLLALQLIFLQFPSRLLFCWDTAVSSSSSISQISTFRISSVYSGLGAADHLPLAALRDSSDRNNGIVGRTKDQALWITLYHGPPSRGRSQGFLR